MKRVARYAAVVLLAALVLGAVAGYVMLPAPARQLSTTSPLRGASVRGAIHVHSRRSDGAGTVEEIAAAAGRAGLTFVVVTDHGDATRQPAPPVYHGGVLCIEAVEISTDGGHAIALGLPKAPYPLAGEPRDVVEDVARLGGMSIAAHPGSAKTELRWLEWTAPFDGLEWLNGDSEWRDESMPTLMRTLFTYPFRGPEALASVLDRPQTVLARWDVLTGRRRVVALAAADAHARLGLRSAGEAFDGPASRLEIPSYEKTFRAFSIALPGAMLTGNARADAAAVLEAIRGGRVYSTIDALAAPGLFSFAATAGNDRAEMGGVLTAGRPVTFRVETNAPSDARITLLRDGNPVITADGASLQHGESGQPGVYRVEVHLPGAAGDPPVPWILSNPIYVRPEDAGKRALLPRAPATEFLERDPDAETSDWTIETSARSQGALDVVKAAAGTQLLFRFGLAGTRSDSPYAAAVMPAGPGLSGYDRVIFTARAAQPMRLSVQLRVPAGSRAERWHRSVYVDQMPREVVVFFDEMTPRGPTERRRPELSNVRDVLFVVDTVNTAPGTSGQIWIDDVKYGK